MSFLFHPFDPLYHCPIKYFSVMEKDKTNGHDEINENLSINVFLERKEIENKVLKKLLNAIEKDQEEKSHIIKKKN